MSVVQRIQTSKEGIIMDREAFEQDVWDSVNESTFTDQWGSVDDSNPDGTYTGVVFTIGETWQGTLYGAEENTYGQRAVYQFDTETEQRQWFNALVEQAEVWEDYGE
jgi:hypothetical protein